MTILHSCDHHDAGHCVPDNRSRKRMLEQFAHAAAFGEAFLKMVRDGDLVVRVLAHGDPIPSPTVEIKADRFLDAWVAFLAWERHRPRGDDLVPPFPPSDISIPKDDDADAVVPPE